MKTVVVNENHLNVNAVPDVPSTQQSSLSSPKRDTELRVMVHLRQQQQQQQQKQHQHQQIQRLQKNERAVTATPKPSTINLNDIFITVKTTKIYHDTRLALIIKTWFQLAKEQVSHIQSRCSKLHVLFVYNVYIFFLNPFSRDVMTIHHSAGTKTIIQQLSSENDVVAAAATLKAHSTFIL